MAFTTFEDTLVAVRNCLCDALSTSSVPPAICCITAGRPVIVECCQGIAWVRMVNAYPTTAFPSQDRTPSNCVPPAWALVVEVGVARCVPQPCGELSPACCETELDVAMLLLEDFAAIRRMVTCCLPPEIRPDEIVAGAWTVTDPEAGCVSGSMQLTIRVLDACAC